MNDDASDPYASHPVAKQSFALDLVVGSLLAVLEARDPGIMADVREDLEKMIAGMIEKSPEKAEFRREMFEIALDMVK